MTLENKMAVTLNILGIEFYLIITILNFMVRKWVSKQEFGS